MDCFNAVALRGICSLHFENHVSPLVRSMQQGQDELRAQLADARSDLEKLAGRIDRQNLASGDCGPSADLQAQVADIRAGLARKACKEDVPTLAYLASLLKGGGGVDGLPNTGVPTLVKLQELGATLLKKADAADATNAHLKKAMAAIELTVETLAAEVRSSGGCGSPVEAKDTSGGSLPVALSRLDALEVAVSRLSSGRGGDSLAGSPSRPQPVSPARRPTAQAAAASASLELRLLELERRATSPPPGEGGGTDIKRVQIVVAAAGARFDKQLREVRQQLTQFRRDLAGCVANAPTPPQDLASRWPGRVLGDAGAAAAEANDAASEVCSVACASDAGSAVASVCGSVSGLNPEERAELRKIQAVVGAAGTQFSRELREVRVGLRDLRAEVHSLKGTPQTPRRP